MLDNNIVLDNSTPVINFIDMIKNICVYTENGPYYKLDGYKFINLIRSIPIVPPQTFGNYERYLKPVGSISGPGPNNSIVRFKNYFYVNFELF
jgi:hypothetical protein